MNIPNRSFVNLTISLFIFLTLFSTALKAKKSSETFSLNLEDFIHKDSHETCEPLKKLSQNNVESDGPIGGGKGYKKIFQSGDFIVSNLAELQDALKQAVSGDVIFIKKSIDLLKHSISIPEGVTLAGSRGSHFNAEGATLYSDSMKPGSTLISIREKNVTISGLQIKGSSPSEEKIPAGKLSNLELVLIKVSAPNIRIQNTKLSHADRAAIEVKRNGEVFATHLSIEEIPKFSVLLGIDGAALYLTSSLIHWSWNAILSVGSPGSHLEVSNNIFIKKPTLLLDYPYSHGKHFAIVVNAEEELSTKRFLAGDFISIRENTFHVQEKGSIKDHSYDQGYGLHEIIINGVPREVSQVNENCFFSSKMEEAILNELSTRRFFYQNLNTKNNFYLNK